MLVIWSKRPVGVEAARCRRARLVTLCVVIGLAALPRSAVAQAGIDDWQTGVKAVEPRPAPKKAAKPPAKPAVTGPLVVKPPAAPAQTNKAPAGPPANARTETAEPPKPKVTGPIVVMPPEPATPPQLPAEPAVAPPPETPAEAAPAPPAGASSEPPSDPSRPAGTTEVTRSPDSADSAAQPVQIRLVALLTEDGQQITQGLVWRVYRAQPQADAKDKLVGTHLESAPLLKLKPGEYMVNAAFGRAHMTRKIVVKPAQATTAERFVLNAGGLRLNATANGAEAASAVSYSIYADERDQFDNRTLVMSGAKPGLVHRLNAGIYQIVSRHGDANATVQADVTVEAGKLTEVAVAHAGAAITLKLVTRAGGEALPGTQWLIQTAGGETVKESVGALPTHILAAGDYTVTAKSGARAFKRAFKVVAGQATQVEVVMP